MEQRHISQPIAVKQRLDGLHTIVPSRDVRVEKTPLRVLFFEDDADDVELSLLALESSEFQVTADVASNTEELIRYLRSTKYDIILSDYRMPMATGMDAFALIKAEGVSSPFILVTGSLGDEKAVECLKEGVTDYVIKDRLARLPVAIRRALEDRRMSELKAEAEQALRRSEARYRSLIQNAPCGVLRVESETGILLDANPALATMLGYPTPELLVQKSERGEIRLDPEICRWMVDESAGQGGVRQAEVDWKATNGETVRLELRGRLHTGHGGTETIELIAENVTDRRRAEERIRHLNRLYSALSRSGQAIVRIRNTDVLFTEICRIIVEQAGFKMAWMGLVDPAGTDVRPAASWGGDDGYLTGIRITTADEASGRGPVGTAIRENRHVLIEDVGSDPRMAPWRDKALLRGYGSVGTFPIRVMSRVIGAIAIYAEDAAHFDPDCVALLNEMAANISLALEATELQRLHAQAVDELNQFYTLSLDMLCMCGMDGAIRRLNPAWHNALGFTDSELLSKPLLELFHVRDQPHVKAALKALDEGNAVNWLEARIVCKNGSCTWITGNLIPVPKQAVFLAAFRDNTERKRLEAELTCQNMQLNEQNRRVEAANRMKSQFLANMSHELRSPLNAIIGFTEVLYDEKLGSVPTWARELLGRIQKSATHLLQLINGVLDLSKIEAGHLELMPEEVSVPDAVAEVVGSLSVLAAGKAITVVTELDPQIDEVITDAARLKQLLYNYLSNAIKFTNEAGTVTVRIRPEGENHFRLEVADTGMGIPEKDKPRLFTEFEQLDATASKRHGGTGLGLAVTRRIVEAQGGRVGVSSVFGKGSTFYAVLPRAPGVHLPTIATILVIEDDNVHRYILTRMLEDAGYTAETATTCAEATAKCRQTRFDAITLDLLLPDAPGWEALRKIRSMDQHRKTPVIVISAVEEDHIMIPDEIQAFFSKPAAIEDVVRVLEQAGISRNRKGNGEDAQ